MGVLASLRAGEQGVVNEPLLEVSNLVQEFTVRDRGTGLADRMWAPDFGDRMLVIARRAPARASA